MKKKIDKLKKYLIAVVADKKVSLRRREYRAKVMSFVVDHNLGNVYGKRGVMGGREVKLGRRVKRVRMGLSSSWISHLSSLPALNQCRSSLWISLIGVELFEGIGIS